MADSPELTPELRCYVLVGQFLQAWSAMEIALHNAIGAAFNLESVQTKILCANIHFRDKIHILRTLVGVSSFPEQEKAQAKSKLRKLGNHAVKRNMVAHSAFVTNMEGTGVMFLTTKARGEYDPSAIIWSRHRFEQEDRALESYAKFLDNLRDCFRRRPLTQPNYVNALLPFLQTDWSVPMPRPVPLGLLRSLTQPVPVPPDSDQASGGTAAQTPDKPREGE
jgi:hypothetical protein